MEIHGWQQFFRFHRGSPLVRVPNDLTISREKDASYKIGILFDSLKKSNN